MVGRGLWLAALAACGFTPTPASESIDSSTGDGNVVAGAWWDPAYAYRAPIRVTTTAAVDAGYAVMVSVDTAALVASGHAHASDDWRIVRHSGDTWQELDRWIDDAGGKQWNSTDTRTWFRIPTAIAATTTDDQTYVYYGASSPTAPPSRLGAIFLFGDDFETTLGQWNANGLGETLTIEATHAGGASSLKFITNGTAAAGMHRDLALPATQLLMFSHYVRQAQTSASFGEGRGFGVTYAMRTPPTFVDSNLRLATELDSGDHLQIWGMAQLYNWYMPFGVNTWHEVETVYDSVHNTVKSRADGGAWSGPYNGAYTQGTPIVSIAVEGEGGQPGTFWLDNYVIRPYVEPEPTAQLGAEEALQP